MSFNYPAVSMPVPTVLGTPPIVANCTSTATTAPTPPSNTFATNDRSTVPKDLNETLAQLAAAFGYAGNGIGVVNGLVLSAASGLSLPVTAGHASNMGYLEYAGGTITVPDNTPLVFVWLLQNQTLAITTTTTPPATNACLLGNCTTLSGNITAVDFSAVCYIVGGFLIRHTADTGIPGDSPNAATAFLTLCPAGVYLWDGIAYKPIWEPAKANKFALVSGDSVYVGNGFQVPYFGGFSMQTGSTLSMASGAQFRVTA
jgi:hypothetical protein